MKVFQLNKRMLAWVGILEPTSPNAGVVNLRNAVCFVVLFLFCTATILYLKKSESFQEFTDTCFGIFVAVACVSIFSTLVAQTHHIYNAINHLDQILEMRESFFQIQFEHLQIKIAWIWYFMEKNK